MIILDDKYCIDADECCYSLKIRTRKKAKDGSVSIDESGNPEYTFRGVGYYTGLNKAISAWYDALNRGSIKKADMGLREALSVISANADKVNKAIRDAIPEVPAK